jgi:IS5 family transposase
MKPKSQETSGQIDLFNTPLADLLNPKHELYQLANLIDWKVLDDAFGEFFAETQGAPALPTRLIAGLHYLKHAFARSDEAVVAQWLDNRKRHFNHVYPCRLKSPKIVSTYNQVDTYDGEQESFISTIGRGAAERWPLSV